jgi:hypothetical protein
MEQSLMALLFEVATEKIAKIGAGCPSKSMGGSLLLGYHLEIRVNS